MIVDDWLTFAEWRDRQEAKWREPQKQLVRVEPTPLAHPPISGDGRFSAQETIFGPGPYGAVWNDGSKYERGITSTGSGNVYDHPLLLQNSRTAYGESLQARSLVRRYADTIVDTGLRYIPQPKADILGISASRAERWASEVSQRFDCWFLSKQCALDESNNGPQLQRFIEILRRRDGEYFVRFHYSGRKDLINPLQLSIVDPTQIVGYGLTDTYGLNQGRHDGIERDKNGREIGYFVMVLTEKGYETRRIPAIGPRSGRRFMLHGYEIEYPGQGRGMSELAHAVQNYSQLTDFTQAQIIKAITQSQLNFVGIPSKDAPMSNPFHTNAGIIDTYQAPLETPEATSEIAQLVYSRLPEVISTVPGATTVLGLQSGEGLEAVPNTAPVEQFASFVEAFMTYLCASSSMPIEVQTMKFGRSYTASMGALILFWRVAKIGRAEQASDWLNPLVESWMSEEIAAGRISAPGWSDPLRRAAWLNCEWGGAPMPIIDPSKQSKADKDYIEMGAQHLDDVARNHNGSDGSLNRAKLQRQIPELTPVPWSKGASTPGGSNPGESEEPEMPEDEGE